MNKELSLFDWLVSLFKKKSKTPSIDELAADAKWHLTKAKYRIEFLKEHDAWFVQYKHHNGEWLYLRRWPEDYTLERARGNAIRISDPNELDSVIRLHQDWINEGHIFMSFE